MPSGSLAKASSVGANTVKGPSPLSVSTRSAAPKAAARVVKRPSATAVSTMSDNIGSGIAVGSTVGSAVGIGVAWGAHAARAIIATSKTESKLKGFIFSPVGFVICFV